MNHTPDIGYWKTCHLFSGTLPTLHMLSLNILLLLILNTLLLAFIREVPIEIKLSTGIHRLTTILSVCANSTGLGAPVVLQPLCLFLLVVILEWEQNVVS